MIDVMEAIVGDLPQRGEARTPGLMQRDDGAWVMDASLSVAEINRSLLLGVPVQPAIYESIGGFMIDRFGHIPRAGESFMWNGWRLEIVAMDGHRIERILVAPMTAPHAAKRDLA